MSDRLHFSPAFAKRMVVLSLFVGITIAVLMPVTNFLTNWHKFSEEARIRGEDISWKMQETIRVSPEFWYYSVPKYINTDNLGNHHHVIQTVVVYDRNSTQKFKATFNSDILFSYPFRTPVLYNNEIYGYIEIYQNILPFILETLGITLIFGLLGLGIAWFLYWYPVHIVRLMEKDVQNYAEQAKRKAESEVARLDRLKLVGQMAASIAHEVRNPLTTVKGYLQLFARKDTFSPYSAQIELMIEELDRSNYIITEFLSLSHNKTVTMEKRNLNQIIEALKPLIESDGIMQGIAVEYDLQNTPEVLLDEKEIRQLILNIVRNGFEAMSTGQKLIIKTDKIMKAVVLSIVDQGRGIAPSLLNQLGTPFLTTKATGTGLGLAVCYSIAHRHGTTLHFVSSPQGTTCRIPFQIPK